MIRSSPDTAARVRRAAERLADVPNRIAGGLSSQKSRVVIAVIPSTLNPVFSEMVEALRADLLRANYHLFLGLFDYATRREGELVDTDLLAMGVLYEASARALSVPAQLAVIGFGNLSASAHCYPSLTTVAVDGDRVGREAARLLLERLEGKTPRPRSPQILDVGSRVIAREST